MEKNHRISNFWFGFGLGTIFTIFFMFLFGTKKGRKTLKNFLEFSENIEENLFELLTDLKINLKENAEENKNNIPTTTKNNLFKIIDQIKFLTHPEVKKQTKKFFVKEGRIVEKSS
jgi:hypothetical protein